MNSRGIFTETIAGCACEIESAGSRRANKGSRRGKQPELTGYFHAATAKEQSGKVQEHKGTRGTV